MERVNLRLGSLICIAATIGAVTGLATAFLCSKIHDQTEVLLEAIVADPAARIVRTDVTGSDNRLNCYDPFGDNSDNELDACYNDLDGKPLDAPVARVIHVGNVVAGPRPESFYVFGEYTCYTGIDGRQLDTPDCRYDAPE